MHWRWAAEGWSWAAEAVRGGGSAHRALNMTEHQNWEAVKEASEQPTRARTAV